MTPEKKKRRVKFHVEMNVPEGWKSGAVLLFIQDAIDLNKEANNLPHGFFGPVAIQTISVIDEPVP